MIGLLAAKGGAAELAKETRPVANFDQVVLRAVGDLTIKQGEEERLVVEAERSLLPKLTSQVRAGVLYLGTEESFSTQYPIRYALTVKRLSRLTSEGTGQVAIAELAVPSLEVKLAGSGGMSVSTLTARELTVKLGGSANVNIDDGTVTTQRVAIDGSGRYAAPRLASERASVSINGSGEVVLKARDTLSVQIAGSGTVSYHGDPAVSRTIVGAGSVTRASTL